MKQVVFGCSVQGASHIRSGTACQDSYKRVICDDGAIILSVADGHGSKTCPFSHIGSKIAVRVFCSFMKRLYEGYEEHPEQLITYLNREGSTRISQNIDAEWKARVVEVHRKAGREILSLEDGREDLFHVYSQYGTTLLGLLITKTFVFAFQLGDGDICYASEAGFEMVIEPEKILGVETHSLSREKAWEKAETIVHRFDIEKTLPAMFTLSTDGFANSYPSGPAFHETVRAYLNMINQYGAKAVEENLPDWLSETSSMGCGDDVTMAIAYFAREQEETTIKAEDNR